MMSLQRIHPVAPRRARISTWRSIAVAMTLIAPAAVVLAADPPAHPAPGLTAAASDACGVRPAKSNGTLWSCTFADDFSGTALDPTKWMPQTQFSTGTDAHRACYLNDPSTINEAGGVLNLTLHRVTTPVHCRWGGTDRTADFVSGSVMTYHLFSQQYGRFEARVKNTAALVPGLQESFWLWPDNPYTAAVYPVSGEIDVAETYSSQPHLAIPFLHYAADAAGPVPGLNTAWNCPAERGVWNTYTLIWSATRIEIDVNGRPCLVNNTGDVAFDKKFIMALTQLIGAKGNEYDGRAPMPATMSIDYVRVWR
jgi:beta-glucanase (GH16 family)